jgi:hypothetical protein
MAHLLTHDPTTCGVGTLNTNNPQLQGCGAADLLCVSTVTANGTVTRGGRANLLCVSTVTANGTVTRGGRANLLCVADVVANAMKTANSAANLKINSRIFVGFTTITRIIRGGKTTPANACVRSNNKIQKVGGVVNLPKSNTSNEVPTTNTNVNVPKTNTSGNIPKVSASYKTKILRINNGRKC